MKEIEYGRESDQWLLLLFEKVDQQDVPITGQPIQSTDEVREKTKKKKENDRTTNWSWTMKCIFH
jgi:hypothetical protein